MSTSNLSVNSIDKKQSVAIFKSEGSNKEFELRTNSLYKVINRKDADAPDGFIEHGTTKLPSLGISNTVQCRYTAPQGGSEIDFKFDTGFYPESPCYFNKSIEERMEHITLLKKHIVQPYEASSGGDKILSHTNEDWWSEYSVEIEYNKVFNTSQVSDLLALYIILQSGHVAPEGMEGDPKYSQSDYTILDIDKTTAENATTATNKLDVMFEFGTLLRKDKSKLKSMLSYMGLLGVRGNQDDSSLKALFSQWISENSNRVSEFNRILEKVNTEKGKIEIEAFRKGQVMLEKGVIARMNNGRLIYQSRELGSDLKSSISNLMTNPDLENIKIKFLEEDV
jgi:hypothetical protein|tara:strand:+ start:336 stop:1349 length:1014 start_codon:yes stop_codon:yes gene_type:complete